MPLTAKSNLNCEMLKALNLTISLGVRAAAGWLFKELKHKWFSDRPPPPCVGHHRHTGMGKESVHQLVHLLIHWMPSVCNFGNIDAAFVDVNWRAHMPQCTIQPTHSLDQSKFQVDVIGGFLAMEKLKTIDVVHKRCTVPFGISFTIPTIQAEMGDAKHFGHTVHIARHQQAALPPVMLPAAVGSRFWTMQSHDASGTNGGRMNFQSTAEFHAQRHKSTELEGRSTPATQCLSRQQRVPADSHFLALGGK